MWISEWHETEETRRSGYRLHLITADEPWSYPEHRHEGCCEIVVLIYGRLTQAFSTTTLQQEPGQVILLRDGDVHALSGSNFSYVNVMFSPSWLTRLEAYTQLHGLIAKINSEPTCPLATVPETERRTYYELVDELRRYHDHEYGRQVFANFLARTVTRYLAPVVSIDIPDGCPDWLAETLAWLHHYHDAPPSLDELITHTCRCKEHVTRQFTRWLGTSPARYLAGLRVDRAAELLGTTNYPVQEICNLVGFNNESYFYRLFSQQKDMTPGEWRREHGSRSIQTTTKTPEKGREEERIRVSRIVSGAQTGADRGALDAAICCNVPHGGWCPKGRKAEDGVIPSKYALKEMSSPAYIHRTEQNVVDSDATLVLTRRPARAGSLKTIELARDHGKPCLHIDIDKTPHKAVQERIYNWIQGLTREPTHLPGDCVLNVAGNRESNAAGIHDEVKAIITDVLNRLKT